jgi:hypothetical protein
VNFTSISVTLPASACVARGGPCAFVSAPGCLELCLVNPSKQLDTPTRRRHERERTVKAILGEGVATD